MRRRARKDDNQDDIVAALKQVPGVSVAYTHQLGGGLGDIIVGFRGVNYLAEIKDGSKPPSRQKLTDDEKKFHGEWQGTIHIINSIDAALKMIGAIE